MIRVFPNNQKHYLDFYADSKDDSVNNIIMINGNIEEIKGNKVMWLKQPFIPLHTINLDDIQKIYTCDFSTKKFDTVTHVPYNEVTIEQTPNRYEKKKLYNIIDARQDDRDINLYKDHMFVYIKSKEIIKHPSSMLNAVACGCVPIIHPYTLVEHIFNEDGFIRLSEKESLSTFLKNLSSDIYESKIKSIEENIKIVSDFYSIQDFIARDYFFNEIGDFII